MQKAENFKYIVSTVKSSFLPALFFCVCLLLFYTNAPYEANFAFSLHSLVYFIAGSGLLFLCMINQAKPFYSLLAGTVAYLLLNICKIRNGSNYANSPEYIWLCFLLPLNLLFFYFLPQAKLRTLRSAGIFIFLLLQMAFVQHFGGFISNLPYLDLNFGKISVWSLLIWVLTVLPLFFDVCLKNTIINTGLFYADLCLFTGLLYSGSASGLTTFFLGFAAILFLSSILYLYHRYNYDSLEHVGSYNAYLNHASSNFPYKYTVVLFCIDEHDKLLAELGINKFQELEQLIVNRILEFPQDISFYRYVAPEELVMVFKNEDGKHTKEYAENIRHVIAAASFVLTNGKKVKLTISACYSEKTRLDLNAANVILRAHNTLPKRLTNNVVIPAPAALPETNAVTDIPQ